MTVFKRSEKGSLYQKAVPAMTKINASRSKGSIFLAASGIYPVFV